MLHFVWGGSSWSHRVPSRKGRRSLFAHAPGISAEKSAGVVAPWWSGPNWDVGMYNNWGVWVGGEVNIHLTTSYLNTETRLIGFLLPICVLEELPILFLKISPSRSSTSDAIRFAQKLRCMKGPQEILGIGADQVSDTAIQIQASLLLEPRTEEREQKNPQKTFARMNVSNLIGSSIARDWSQLEVPIEGPRWLISFLLWEHGAESNQIFEKLWSCGHKNWVAEWLAQRLKCADPQVLKELLARSGWPNRKLSKLLEFPGAPWI